MRSVGMRRRVSCVPLLQRSVAASWSLLSRALHLHHFGLHLHAVSISSYSKRPGARDVHSSTALAGHHDAGRFARKLTVL